MRVFKLSKYSLKEYQHKYDYDTYTYRPKRTLIPGVRVCALSGLKNMGVITHVGPEIPWPGNPETVFVEDVTVLWLTGPHKGKIQAKKTSTLSCFDDYKAAVASHLAEIEAIEVEASKTGM